jgi:2-(1,2-epoxy-1,2-dihydrophenyl)acetyl-CoA isomerase
MRAMQFKHIAYSKESHIATITLNRPDRLNAIVPSMLEEMIKALADAVKDAEVRVLIFTGAGRGFCSGADLRSVTEEPPSISLANRVMEFSQLLLSAEKPIIAAINGPAAGWGCELALLCDMRIASERARFAEVFVRLGVVPDGGGTWLLPRLVGWGRASEMLFTGKQIDAIEAERIGLVNRVVPHDELESATRELADSIVRNPPLAVRMIKRAMRLGLKSDLQVAIEQGLQDVASLAQSEDTEEALSAFLQKRPAIFKGI